MPNTKVEAEKVEPLLPIRPLDDANSPPIDRYCDVVLEGGVVNGVVYPGFLMELARKFHFHAIAGTSVGAIAAALAAACEYNRRFGGNNGFNQGLAQMPVELAEWVDKKETITKIQSLFQPDKQIKQLFDWAVDVIGSRVKAPNKARLKSSQSATTNESLNQSIDISNLAEISSWKTIKNFYSKLIKHFNLLKSFSRAASFRERTLAFLMVSVTTLASVLFLLIINAGLVRAVLISAALLGIGAFFIWPFVSLALQINRMVRMPGFGMCTGMRAEGDPNISLIEWLHEGIQKSAQLQLHRPLTFGELWRTPGGPEIQAGVNDPRSIDLRMITTCLSQGRIYELPQKNEDAPILFRLSELKDFFPASVIDHLRKHSLRFDINTNALIKKRFDERRRAARDTDPDIDTKIRNCQSKLENLFNQPEPGQAHSVNASAVISFDIRVLPAADLPIVVAARMSMSCPILFQAVPFLGFNFDTHAEDMEVVRLWFSDGGIGSNFPINIFDQAIPKWPTLGLKLLDESPRLNSKREALLTYLPFFHYLGAEDNLIFPRDQQAFAYPGKPRTWGTFIQFLFSIYTSAKDGSDQSYLRTPSLRNRVVRVYMNNRSGNALNLQISPDVINWLGCKVGVQGGKNAADAYLADLDNDKYRDFVNLWQDHRWVRMRMLIDGLRKFLNGAGLAVNSNVLTGAPGAQTLREQIEEAKNSPQLRSLTDTESALTIDQAAELNAALDAIIALEKQLAALDLPQAYTPTPQSELRFKPQV